MRTTFEQSRSWHFLRTFVVLGTIVLFAFGSFISVSHTHPRNKTSESGQTDGNNSKPVKKNTEDDCLVCIAKFSSGIIVAHFDCNVVPIHEQIFCDAIVESPTSAHFSFFSSRAPPCA